MTVTYDPHGFDLCARCAADLTVPGTRVVRYEHGVVMKHYCENCWSLVPNGHPWQEFTTRKVRQGVNR